MIDAAPRSRLLAHLTAMRSADGGWATSFDRESDVESTAWVLIGASLLPALSDHHHAALDWLLRQQNTDGSWNYRPGLAMAAWPTAPALIALTLAGASAEARTHATSWLVNEHSAVPTRGQRAFQRIALLLGPGSEPAVVQDATLDGFGWARHTFAWVEPTAISMIALALQARTHATTQRVAIGAQILLDRQSTDGGWNYGNKRVLQVDLPGYPDTTGWALLGLAAAARSGILPASTTEAAGNRGFEALAASDLPRAFPLPAALGLLAQTAHQVGETSARSASLGRMQTSLITALDGVGDGYPMLDTRTVILALLASHETDLLGSLPR